MLRHSCLPIFHLHRPSHVQMGHLERARTIPILAQYPVVLENSNVAKLASTQYLAVHSLPQEDCYDTDDASPREIYAILVPKSTLCPVQLSRRRQYRASVVDRDAQAH